MYANVEEYVRAHGYELSDLTKSEISRAKKEMEAVNAGEQILDGVFSDFVILNRKIAKEAGR